MRINGSLAAVGLNVLCAVFVYSLWAQWGPYAWIAGAQVALGNGYFPTVTFLLLALAFALAGIFLLTVTLSAPRWMRAIGLGLPALVIAVHFVATVYFLITGGETLAQITFEQAIHAASVLPKNIILDQAQLPPLDPMHAVSIVESRSSSGKLYVPLDRSHWASDGTPVFLECSDSFLKDPAPTIPLRGTIRKMPLPYLVRRAQAADLPQLSIVISQYDSVRFVWGMGGAVYTILFVTQLKEKRRTGRWFTSPNPVAAPRSADT